jgi:hypothetical protein
MSALK